MDLVTALESTLNGAVLSSFHSGTTNQPELSASTLKREVEKFWIHYSSLTLRNSLFTLQFLQNKCDAVGVAGIFH